VQRDDDGVLGHSLFIIDRKAVLSSQFSVVSWVLSVLADGLTFNPLARSESDCGGAPKSPALFENPAVNKLLKIFLQRRPWRSFLEGSFRETGGVLRVLPQL
jgi:hypothetical protein